MTTRVNSGAGRWLIAALLSAAMLTACGGGGSGTGAATAPPAPATPSNSAPSPVIVLAGPIQTGTDNADVTTSVGADVILNAGGSTDKEGDAITYAWSIVSKPNGSAAMFSAASASQTTIKPDMTGTYVVNLLLSDSKGASSEKRITILVNNTGPNAVVVVSTTFTVVPTTKPTQGISIGAAVLLDATNSTDPDGDAVTTSWSLLEKPDGSTAALTLGTKTARFVADLKGTYKVKARAADAGGALVETIYVFDAANRSPDAIVLATVTPTPANGGQNVLPTSVGYVVSLSGASSSDPDGNSITYAWSLVSKPAGSSVQLTSTTAASVQLTPDALGDYIVKLVVTAARPPRSRPMPPPSPCRLVRPFACRLAPK